MGLNELFRPRAVIRGWSFCKTVGAIRRIIVAAGARAELLRLTSIKRPLDLGCSLTSMNGYVRSKTICRWSLLCAASLWIAGQGALGQETPIPPGLSLFETWQDATTFRFAGAFALPAGFFAPDSEKFQGRVDFAGVPLRKFSGQDVGSADTVLSRLAESVFSRNDPRPPSARVDIELLRLSLATAKPIAVRVGAGSQNWNVKVELSRYARSTGALRLLRTNNQGGSVDAEIRLVPRFTFTRASDGATRFVDYGQPRGGSNSEQAILLEAKDVPWTISCPKGVAVRPKMNDVLCVGSTTTGFIPVRFRSANFDLSLGLAKESLPR